MSKNLAAVWLLNEEPFLGHQTAIAKGATEKQSQSSGEQITKPV